jgi:hypothetical protein
VIGTGGKWLYIIRNGIIRNKGRRERSLEGDNGMFKVIWQDELRTGSFYEAFERGTYAM